MSIRLQTRHFAIEEKEDGKIAIHTHDHLYIYGLLAINSANDNIEMDYNLLLQKITAIGYLFSHKKEGEKNKIIVFHDGPDASCGGTGKTSLAVVLNGFIEMQKYMHPSIHERDDNIVTKQKAKAIIIDSFGESPAIIKNLCDIDQKVLVITNKEFKELPEEFVSVEFTFPFKGPTIRYDKLKSLCKMMLTEAEEKHGSYQYFIDGCIMAYEEFGLITK